MDDKIVSQIKDMGTRIKENVGHVIVGKSDAVELIIVAILCEGHVLIEDVPGLGKTMLAKSVSRSLGCVFRRIQCTPDLLPSDITGTHIFNQKSSDFEFKSGPIMANVVLVDEINRATPRTQSALLEAMQERQITAEGETKLLPRPFVILATQNPIELEGTFPLPEAQLDRFLLKVKIGYPSSADDRTILGRFRKADPLEELNPVVSSSDLLRLQLACREIHINIDVENYIINIVHATREHQAIQLGVSPRAMLALYHASQALAALRGRLFVIPDDIKYLVGFTLAHRILPKSESYLRGQKADELLKEIVDSVPVPIEEDVNIRSR